ncbi:MAG: lysophospholipid acyltransferase family protein [Candidatus Eisenbacteria bacterium]|nr:lysophospholipid acyltransferase family protein [Candidatus Eisenbacteria bacterium]
MIGYLLYQIAAALASFLPVRVSYFFARRISEVKYLADKYSRHSVRSNLRRVLPEGVNDGERKKVEKQVFRNFSCFVVDFLRLSNGSGRKEDSRVTVEGWERIKSALQKKKGLILTTAHFGNWELGASLLARSGFRLKVVARRHENRRINKFFNRRRERFGIEVLEQGGSKSSVLGWLREGGCIAILADRQLGGSGGKATFFGHDTVLPRAHVALALRTGAPLIPGFVRRERNGDCKVIIEPEIELSDLGKNRSAVRTGVERCLVVFEDFIRLHPDQWFVFDEVWPEKTRRKPDDLTGALSEGQRSAFASPGP